MKSPTPRATPAAVVKLPCKMAVISRVVVSPSASLTLRPAKVKVMGLLETPILMVVGLRLGALLMLVMVISGLGVAVLPLAAMAKVVPLTVVSAMIVPAVPLRLESPTTKSKLLGPPPWVILMVPGVPNVLLVLMVDALLKVPSPRTTP